MIAGISASVFAVILLGWLLFRGDAGRLGIILAAAAGSAIGFAATIFAVIYNLAGVLVSVAQSLAGIG